MRAALGVLLLCACATEPVAAHTSFDASAGEAEVTVLGDGFVRAGERRIPLEAAVLELRQRTRAMAKDELLRFVVRVRVERPADEAAAAIARRGLERMVGELQIMGVRQVRVL